MAVAILSQDIVAICLWCGDGNINLSLSEVIGRVEKYQEAQNRHFGISRSDYHDLFLMLIYSELGIKSFGDEIDDIKMRDIINNILEYHDAYFNDEGNHWITTDEIYSDDIGYWFRLTEKEYEYKMAIKQRMKEFFRQQKIAELDPEVVKKFMAEINITEAMLHDSSRPGKSS